MHYYQFNIGDYAGHTRNLSLMEDLAYRRLLDAYYLSERPFNGCSTDVARDIGMRDQVDAVEYVLSKFFEQTPDGWRNKRADSEIAQYTAKKQQASNAGKASAQRRSNARSTTVQQPLANGSTDVQPTNNHKPITNNQETVVDAAEAASPAKQARARQQSVPKPDDVSDQAWSDWLALRKAKKAPVTQTVVDGAKSEAAKAGISLEDFLRIWCTRGSQGLQASWIRQDELPGWVQRTPSAPPVIARRQAIEAHNQAVADQFLMGDEVFYDAE